jgi:hypothetical protein
MIKPLYATDAKFRGHLGYTRWTVCLGAGASSQVVPSWIELTRRLTNRVFKTKYTDAEFKAAFFYQGWGLDSWIQAAANHHKLDGGDLSSFQGQIQDILYEDLLSEAATVGVADDLLAALEWPRAIKRKQVEKVCNFFELRYGKTSLMGMVKWLIAAEKKDKLPFAIISFNAEPLLHTVFELFQRLEHYKQPPPHSHPKYRFTRIVKPHFVPRDADENGHKIPIYHCHGALIPRSNGATSHASTGDNTLVFLEQDYLKVSTTAATWPETIFMYHASLSRMLFVGLSMSDPNIRRWLGLSEVAATAGQTLRGPSSGPPHLWLTKEPIDPGTKQVSLEGLCHLGVRPAWIDDWPDLEAGLRNITAV